MTRVSNFIADLLKGGKSVKKVKKLAEIVYGEKALKDRAIYKILKQVKARKNTDDQRRFNGKKWSRKPALIGAGAADVEKNCRICVKTLASVHQVPVGTIFKILHRDLGLVKKSAQWVPKLLSQEQIEARVGTSAALLKHVFEHKKGYMNNFMRMDESTVAMQTLETNRQGMQWLKKGTSGLVKVKVAATRAKQMVLVFCDNKGVLYTNYVPRGKTVNADYIIDALGRFMKIVRVKRPHLAPWEWKLH
jgi:hypothetical protein